MLRAAAVVPKSFRRPVVASQARSRAQEIVDTNRERVEALTAQARRDLVRTLIRAQKEIEARLASQFALRAATTWTDHDLLATLVQVRIALATIQPKLAALLAENDSLARAFGVRNTTELLAYFERVAPGTMRPLAIAESAALHHTVLERHATSVDRYGRHMIGVIRRDLQAGIVRGATFEEMVTLLVGKRGPRGIVSMAAREIREGVVQRTREETIAEGLFVRYRGWAERIVRTEGMTAMNAGAQEEMIAQQAKKFPDLKRKIVATFDRRTAFDSRGVHGQIRGLHEPFVDGAGRVYMLPPARPNDREVVIPWREAWAEPAPVTTPDSARSSNASRSSR